MNAYKFIKKIEFVFIWIKELQKSVSIEQYAQFCLNNLSLSTIKLKYYVMFTHENILNNNFLNFELNKLR